ncbi:MAG: 4Fe-4S binding protein [Deltaproteobacteria bacterium]|nr:4Fe-4S binding protein [Deltaproteobacteria bacterium]
MEQDIYRELMMHLGKVGIGYPQIDGFLEVLQKTLTVEEAEVALGLPTRLPPLEVEEADNIAQRLQRPTEEIEMMLQRLAGKGFLYKRQTPSGKVGYAFIQIGFGIPQIFFWKGEITDAVKEIAPTLGKYLRKTTPKARGSEHTRFYRYVPVNKAVDHGLQAVYTYDMMTEVVNKAKKIAVVHCSCRQTRRLLTNSTCTHSLEVCIKFNKMAEFVLDKRLGREITKGEALEIIRKSEEEGLIHFVDNCQEEIQHNCNCCACCCWTVMPIKKRLVPRDYIMATYYLRTTDEDLCTACGQCAEDCPLEIITMENDLPVVDESICIGCGLCLLHCPIDAAKLKRKDDRVPAKDFVTLHETAIRETITQEERSGE